MSYNRDYTKKQVKVILEIIQDCIKCNRYIISKNENRSENIDFINNYNLSSVKQKEILLRIEPNDFCYSVKNTKLGFEHEVLYVFCPQMTLFNFDGEEDLVYVYIKFNIINNNDDKRVVTVSFHKRNKSIDYLFK